LEVSRKFLSGHLLLEMAIQRPDAHLVSAIFPQFSHESMVQAQGMQTHLVVSLSPLLDATLDQRVLQQFTLMQLALFVMAMQPQRLATISPLTVKWSKKLQQFLK
jgi:hypothetical protein